MSLPPLERQRSQNKVVVGHADRIVELHPELSQVSDDTKSRVSDVIKTIFPTLLLEKPSGGLKFVGLLCVEKWLVKFCY
jgi:hypothetical protein